MKFFVILGLCLVLHPASPGFCQESKTIGLEEALTLALERNEILQMARGDLLRSREGIREARSDIYPQLNLDVDYNRNWRLPRSIFDTPTGRQEVTIGTKNNFTGSLILRQPLFASGKLYSALRSARFSSQFSEQEVRAIHQLVRSEVEIALYDLFLARDLVRVSKLAVERASANLRQVQRLQEVGRVSSYEVLRAQVQVSTLLPDSIEAENRRVVADLNFKNAIGMDFSKTILAEGEFRETTTLNTADVEVLVARGLEARPQLRQANLEIEIVEQQVRVERAGLRPRIDLIASARLQMQSNKLEFSNDDFQQSWFTGVSVEMPLFDGMRTSARVSRARVEMKRAELELKRLKREVGLEIRQAWLDLKVAEKRLEAQTLAVAQARRGQSIAKSRYGNGLGTQLEVLDAQLVLLRAELDFAVEKRERAVSMVELERAVGVLGE